MSEGKYFAQSPPIAARLTERQKKYMYSVMLDWSRDGSRLRYMYGICTVYVRYNADDDGDGIMAPAAGSQYAAG